MSAGEGTIHVYVLVPNHLYKGFYILYSFFFRNGNLSEFVKTRTVTDTAKPTPRISPPGLKRYEMKSSRRWSSTVSTYGNPWGERVGF